MVQSTRKHRYKIDRDPNYVDRRHDRRHDRSLVSVQTTQGSTPARVAGKALSTESWKKDWTKLLYIRVQLTKSILCAKSSRESSRLNYSGKSVNSVVTQEEIGDGLVKVGKIIFDTGQVLGKGCEGTFVYKYVRYA